MLLTLLLTLSAAAAPFAAASVLEDPGNGGAAGDLLKPNYERRKIELKTTKASNPHSGTTCDPYGFAFKTHDTRDISGCEEINKCDAHCEWRRPIDSSLVTFYYCRGACAGYFSAYGPWGCPDEPTLPTSGGAAEPTTPDPTSGGAAEPTTPDDASEPTLPTSGDAAEPTTPDPTSGGAAEPTTPDGWPTCPGYGWVMNNFNTDHEYIIGSADSPAECLELAQAADDCEIANINLDGSGDCWCQVGGNRNEDDEGYMSCWLENPDDASGEYSPTYSPTTSPTYSPTESPTYSPTESPTYSPTETPLPTKCHGLFGGGWTRVRHVTAGMTWHPATDRLSGGDVYGTEGVEDSSWSVRFASKVPKFDQFLFATGDCQKWLATAKDEVIGEYYTNSYRSILASSINPNPYKARWYNREGAAEDPWISLTDHGPAIGQGNILYGENSWGGAHAAKVLPIHDGADVYIRASGSSHRSSNQLDRGGFKYLRGE